MCVTCHKTEDVIFAAVKTLNLRKFLAESPVILAFYVRKDFYKQNVYWIHKEKFLLQIFLVERRLWETSPDILIILFRSH
jgi:hypothetical protein